MVVADQHVDHPNLRIVWAPLANGVIVGACLGILSGTVCTIAYMVLHPDCSAHDAADRAFDLTRGAMFWIAVASGILVGVLSVATFGGRLIYNWAAF